MLAKLCVESNGKGHAGIQEVAASLRDAMEAPKGWTSMLWSFLDGVGAMEAIFTIFLRNKRALEYPACVEQFQDRLQRGLPVLRKIKTESERDSAITATPFLI